MAHDGDNRNEWMNRSDFVSAFDKLENKVINMAEADIVQHGELQKILIRQESMLISVTKLLERHDVMLIGEDGRTGIVADVNTITTATATCPAISDEVKAMKTTIGNIKIGAGLIGAMGGLLSIVGHKLFNWDH